ncbi:FadR/GntR family transcriptional regulator [Parvularcula sp. LCG005]|uniref:FadR/GntR family transcriptional regulator n=1 Tax=Parvularcula sp. LCG005 TaxID=3078805 RepID=UPI0029430B94|nr:FadR/GntR family transcriptional regulator [Parvularcula sp. LCG005]WOI53471.1 FadR/GntR family transcriptional regulator [Parvularcula sp. LCG005]
MAQQRLYAKVTEALADEILRREYAIGDRLPAERVLAESYGVSRPTIREAMIALEVDGLVDIVSGSGVYVRAHERRGAPAPMDVGPYELLEARSLIEAEAAALAATQASPEIIATLERLLEKMEAENARDLVMSEEVDRQFHLTIAEGTNNSALVHVITELWNARASSLQSIQFHTKMRAEGIKPRIDEHGAIVDAIRKRDPDAARAAMRSHLSGVADMIFSVSEADAVARARAEISAERQKYRVRSTL